LFKDYAFAAVSSTYVSRALGLMCLSLASLAVNETVELVKGYFWRNYITELEVSNSDKCYHWLLQWIARHCNDQLLHFSVTTTMPQTESSLEIPKFDYEPSAGEHMFK
jgi:hypothetical protein